MRTFTCTEGGSSKFWNIELKGNTFTAFWGKIGTAGQSKTQTFPDADKARKEHDKLVNEKLKKGYIETTPAGASKPAAAPPALAPAPAKQQAQQPPVATPPPPVTASLCRAFTFSEGATHKFWTIELKGISLTTSWGKVGTAGQSKTQQFPDETKARKEFDKLVNEKTRKGYREIKPKPPADPLRQALEQALVENPDDLAAHSAYADYLSEKDDPRGEFIQIQLALEDQKLPPARRKEMQNREKALLQAHFDDWMGEAATVFKKVNAEEEMPFGLEEWYGDGFSYSFRRGWVDRLHLPEANATFLRVLGQCPTGRILRELTLLHTDYDDPGLSALAKWPNLDCLRKFQIGPLNDSCHIDGEQIHTAIAAMTRIEELYLAAHRVNVKQVFALPMPHLRVLYVYHLHEYPLERLAANKSLTKLEKLCCWPHGLEPGDEGAYITSKAVQALARSKHLKSLNHLELWLSDTGDAGIRAIVESGLIERLKVLDLWNGCITDEGARILAACPAVANLEKLRLSRNMLTRTGIQALQQAGAKVEAEGQYNPARMDQHEYLWEGDPE